MHINWQQRELNLKVVYYGPALSGKTTNLEQIYAKVDPGRRSELISLKTAEDRTLFFDFLQLELGKVGSLCPKIQLYTVPGQSYYEASRRLVLRGADGVVFVADCAPQQLSSNVRAWRDLLGHLASFDIDPNQFPIIIQLNKRDLPNALSTAHMKALLQVNGRPTLDASAIKGVGVLETLKAVTRSVMAQVQQQLV